MAETALLALDERADHILAAIDAKPLATTTKAQYKREVTKALAAGVPLTSATAVADYAAGLNKSSASFLRAALKVWMQRIRLEVKGAATPDNMADVGATLYRLDALDVTIAVEPSRGQKAHVWLSSNGVKRIMNEARAAGRLEDMEADAPLWTSHDRSGTNTGALISHVFSKNLKRYWKTAGLSGRAHIHALRHTVADALYQRTGDIGTVQYQLGHKNQQTSRIYVHSIATKPDKYGSLLDDAFGL